MKAVFASKKDKDLAAQWMAAKTGTPLNPDWYQDNSAIAVKDDNDGTLFALTVLYVEAFGVIGEIAWVICRPDNPPRISYQAVTLAVRSALQLFRNLKVKFVLTHIGSRSINRLLKRNGFAPADKSTEQLFQRLDQEI